MLCRGFRALIMAAFHTKYQSISVVPKSKSSSVQFPELSLLNPFELITDQHVAGCEDLVTAISGSLKTALKG